MDDLLHHEAPRLNSNRARFREDVIGVFSWQEKLPDHTNMISFYFMDDSFSIHRCPMRCEDVEKTFVIVFLQVYFCYKTISVCINITSVCTESTLNVYRIDFHSYRNDLASKRP